MQGRGESGVCKSVGVGLIDVKIYESTIYAIAVKIKIDYFCHIFLSSIVPIVKGLSEDEKTDRRTGGNTDGQ